MGRSGSLGALEKQGKDPGLGPWPCSHEHPTFQGWVSEAEGTQWRKAQGRDTRREVLEGSMQHVEKGRDERPSKARHGSGGHPWLLCPLSYLKS